MQRKQDAGHQAGKSIEVSEYRVLKTMPEEGTREGCLKASLAFMMPAHCVYCGRAPEKLLKPLL